MKNKKGKLYIWKLMLESRILIYYFVVSFTLIFLIYSFIATPSYVSVGRLLPSMASPALSSLAPFLGILTGETGGRISRMARAAGLSLGASSGDMMSAVLQSRTIKEYVIDQCRLHQHYRIPKKNIDDVLKALSQATAVDVTPEDMVVIEVKDRDPKMAKKMVDTYITSLDSFLKESGMTQGKYERIFLEERVKEAIKDLKSAEDSLQNLQEKHRIIVPTEEVKVAISSYAQLKALLHAKEIEFRMKSSYLKKDSPELTELKRQISAYRNKLRELETKEKLDGYGIGSAIPLKGVPDIELKYLRIYRDIKVNEAIYANLLQLYEQAKLTEVRDTPVITILDYGDIPQRPIFPRKLILTILGFILGLFFGVGYVWISARFREYLRQPEYKYIYENFKRLLNDDLRNLKRILFRKK